MCLCVCQLRGGSDRPPSPLLQKQLPRAGRARRGGLRCRFVEELVRSSPQRNDLFTYVADEPYQPERRRVLTLCGRRRATLRHWGPAARHAERRSRRRCDARRRGSRRRHRQERAAAPRQRQQRRLSRHCQFVFSKKVL